MLHHLFAFFLLVLSGISVHAQKIYYVDAVYGKDSNSGKSQTSAWKTCGRVNVFLSGAQAGDVVKFRRGRSYEGQINVVKGGTAGSPVSLDAYGTGDAPVVSGSTKISGWKRFRDHIYRVPVHTKILNVFAGQRQLVLARTPNQGSFFKVDNAGVASDFTDDEVNKPDGFLKGAICHIRTMDFAWEEATVVSSSGSQIRLGPGISYTIKKDNTFFWDNLFSALDAPDEWFATKDSLYVCFRNLKDTSMVLASIYSDGIHVNASHVVVRDLMLARQGNSGILVSNSSGVTISGITIKDISNKGIDIRNSSYVTIAGNTISWCNGQGISGTKISNCVIANNKLSDIGLEPGYGQPGYNGEIGIFVNHEGTGNIIRGNHVERTGYTGIRCDGGNAVIEKNVIRLPLLDLKDGGGIYIWGDNANQSAIRNNYIENCLSSKEKGNAYHNWASGIYLDDRSHGNQVLGNTINDSLSNGIFLHNSFDNTVDGNILYGAPMTVTFDMTVEKSTYQNTIKNNTVVGRSKNFYALNLFSHEPTGFGTLDRNIYFNPYSNQIILCNSPSLGNSAGDLAYWQNLSGQDANSSESNFSWSPYVVRNVIGKNLVSNGTFDENLNDWDHYRDNFTPEWKKDGKMDGGYAYVHFTSDNPSYGAFYTTDKINFQKNKVYQLKFDSASDGFFSLLVRDSDNPVNLKEPITVDNRKTYSIVFKSAQDFTGKVDFATVTYTKSHLFLDNISLYEVNASAKALMRTVLFTNLSDFRKSYSFGQKRYVDLKGVPVAGGIEVEPWNSIVLIRK